jgi:hypothetical protein
MAVRIFKTIQVMILMCCLPMSAQTKKAVSPAPAYSQIQFDPTSLRVPPHFMGHDIVRLYKAIAALHAAEKAEYETTDQFNKRIELAEAKLFMGSKTDTATLSFVVPVMAEYDADRGLLILRVQEGPDRDHCKSIRVRYAKSERSYIGTNAYGATIPVHETDANSYFILINNPKQFPTDSHAVVEHYIECSPDEARRIKGTLSALAVCSLTKGEVLTDKDALWNKPTFDYPHELFEQQWFLKTNLLEMWFFDTSSGKVHAKVGAIEEEK